MTYKSEEARAKARAYSYTYYRDNKEKCKKAAKRYYRKNKHKILAEYHIASALKRMEQNEKRRRQSVESSMASFGLLGFA